MHLNTTTNNTYVLIMAGGLGSRFWPKSRKGFPKQFIDILGTGKSLLQLTYNRLSKVCPPENIYFLTNEIYTDLIKEQIGLNSDQTIIAEPCRRNTAPCIAYATFKIASLNPNANIVIAPSDHLILKEDIFIEKIHVALDFAQVNNSLLTLGIKPSRPDTGYGYIKFSPFENDVNKVDQFLEKPNLEKAKLFVSSGEYVWNAGIFIWNVKSALAAFNTYAKDLYDIFAQGADYYNTAEERSFLAISYPLCRDISLDYAIMEKATNVFTIPADIGWSDLGTWNSLHSILAKDDSNNAVGSAPIKLLDTKDCIIQLPVEKAAVIKGLSDYIIVDDGKVLLIYPKNDEQEIKQVAGHMVNDYGDSYE